MGLSRAFPAPLTASLAAGPIFVVSTGLADSWVRSPASLASAIDPGQAAASVITSVPAILFGFLLSFIPNLFGTGFMLILGFEFPSARKRAAWMATGALFGTAIAWLATRLEEPAVALGLIATSTCCAAICRGSARPE